MYRRNFFNFQFVYFATSYYGSVTFIGKKSRAFRIDLSQLIPLYRNGNRVSRTHLRSVPSLNSCTYTYTCIHAHMHMQISERALRERARASDKLRIKYWFAAGLSARALRRINVPAYNWTTVRINYPFAICVNLLNCSNSSGSRSLDYSNCRSNLLRFPLPRDITKHSIVAKVHSYYFTLSNFFLNNSLYLLY